MHRVSSVRVMHRVTWSVIDWEVADRPIKSVTFPCIHTALHAAWMMSYAKDGMVIAIQRRSGEEWVNVGTVCAIPSAEADLSASGM